jgi:DNA uptake protein ComE-like DNA-binding protein
VEFPVDAAAVPTPPASAAPQGEAEVAEAQTTEGPAALALVDLNTASVADLNHLRGGGNIGRAITAKRPYAAVGDLLTKRVLSRSTFERIREQVTVR